MSYVCAYSSVQLDKSCVEKEFTQYYRKIISRLQRVAANLSMYLCADFY